MSYYGENYFNWQKNIGAFGGTANLFKFADYIVPADSLLDFGCGGGYLLNNVHCIEKVGVEVNDTAREQCRKLGLTVYGSVAQVPDEFATVVISNHALEHVECPLEVLRSLIPKMKPGAKAVFVVPHEGPNEPYHERDISHHLYTWNPMTLGNLFRAAGYVNIKVDTLRHKWPPHYTWWYSKLGPKGFDLLCRLYAVCKSNYQIRAVGESPVK